LERYQKHKTVSKLPPTLSIHEARPRILKRSASCDENERIKILDRYHFYPVNKLILKCTYERFYQINQA
jgi:hypothetical protein